MRSKKPLLNKRRFAARKVKADEIVIFSRQLATMVDAGIPIMQGIDALQEQVTHPTFKRVLVSIRDDIQHGNSLSAAFAKHPAVFDTLYVNMIKVGETGGVLSKILDRISFYLEKTLRLKRKVQSAPGISDRRCVHGHYHYDHFIGQGCPDIRGNLRVV